MLDLDYDLINELKDDLWFYYGAKDHWVPLEYHENLVKNVPDVDAEICSQNIAQGVYKGICLYYGRPAPQANLISFGLQPAQTHPPRSPILREENPPERKKSHRRKRSEGKKRET